MRHEAAANVEILNGLAMIAGYVLFASGALYLVRKWLGPFHPFRWFSKVAFSFACISSFLLMVLVPLALTKHIGPAAFLLLPVICVVATLGLVRLSKLLDIDGEESVQPARESDGVWRARLWLKLNERNGELQDAKAEIARLNSLLSSKTP